MALIEFNATFDDQEVSARLADLVARLSDTGPFLGAVGDYLKDQAGENFKGEHDPDGTPWAALQPSTILRRTKKGQLPLSILNRNKGNTGLAATINWELTGEDGVRVGSPKAYAAVHQFGAAQGQFGAWIGKDKLGRDHFHHLPWGDIPARPFLGIGRDDEAELIHLAEVWLSE